MRQIVPKETINPFASIVIPTILLTVPNETVAGFSSPPVIRLSRVEIKSLPVDTIAQCLGIEEEDVVTKHHDPLVATCGLPFIIAELTSLEVRTQ